MILKLILITTGVLFFIALMIISCCIYVVKQEIEIDFIIDVSEWRRYLKAGDTVMIDGFQYRIESIEGDVAEVTNYNDQMFVLLKDCYPYE